MDEDQIIDELRKQGIDLVSSVPCDRAKGLFFRLPEKFRHIGLTREEDGVGISAGAYLQTGRRLPSRVLVSGTCSTRSSPSR